MNLNAYAYGPPDNRRWIIVVSALLIVAISTTAAYAFARLKFAHKGFVLNSMLLLQMFPVAVALVAGLFALSSLAVHRPARPALLIAVLFVPSAVVCSIWLGRPDTWSVLLPTVALAAAEAVFITNSLVGVRQVAWLDGRAFAPHSLASGLSA